MKLSIEGIAYTLPASLLEVTLQQRIAFDRAYGKDLRQQLKEVLELPEDIHKDLAFFEYQCEAACKTLSHFGAIPLEVVNNTAIEEVLAVYQITLRSFSDEINYEDEREIQTEFAWKDDLWELSPPSLKHNSKMTFGEFLDAKQTVKNLYELGNDRWEALLMLACVFFRKAGELYSESLSEVGGERYRLLQELPLAYALQIAFFFKSSMSSYINRFHSSTLTVNLGLVS